MLVLFLFSLIDTCIILLFHFHYTNQLITIKYTLDKKKM